MRLAVLAAAFAMIQGPANPVISSDGQWDYLAYAGGATLSYEIYDTFPPIMLRCPPATDRLELVFWIEAAQASDFASLVLEREGGEVRFQTTYEPDATGHDFGYAVASFATSDPVVQAIAAQQTPLVFRTASGRRFGFPYDRSIGRIVSEC